MSEPFDFVPEACAATAMAECFLNRECRLEVQGLDSLVSPQGILALDLGTLIAFQLELQVHNECIMAGMLQAFLRAGQPLPFPPGFPTAPEPPDISPVTDVLEAMQAEAEDPMGYLASHFEVTEGTPTRIKSPD